MNVLETHILPLIEEFRQWGSQTSPTFKYWDMFLRSVEIMLQNIRSEREGLWSLHLSSLSAMLPYIYVTNRVNYSRWLPVYILDMLNVPQEVKSAFESGQFSIRQRPGTFNGIWTDMATEKTVIKDSKGSGGIVGLTRQKPALLRWSLTRHILADFRSEMRSRSGCVDDGDGLHAETKPTALKRDEEQTQTLIDHLIQKMTDPFDVESKEFQTSLITVVEEGTWMAFIDSTLSEGQSRSFFGSISRSKLKTFEDLTKKTKLKCRTGEIVDHHINPELIFRRALVLTNSRDDMTVEKILSFPIGSIPTSLFHEDSTMRKSCKADPCHQLEIDVVPTHILESFDRSLTVLIRDDMSLVQCINAKKFKTFADLALDFIKSQLDYFTIARSVVDVFDRYDIKNSIKSAEWNMRSCAKFSQKKFQVIDGRSIPDWKTFLSVNENKQAFIRFLGEYILRSHSSTSVLGNGDELVLAGTFEDPQVVKKVSNSGVVDLFRFYTQCMPTDNLELISLKVGS